MTPVLLLVGLEQVVQGRSLDTSTEWAPLSGSLSLGFLSFFRSKVDRSINGVIKFLTEQPLRIDYHWRVVCKGTLMPLDYLLRPRDFILVGGGVSSNITDTDLPARNRGLLVILEITGVLEPKKFRQPEQSLELAASSFSGLTSPQ